MTASYGILITGHTGFIGRALTTALGRTSHRWWGASRSQGCDLEQPGVLCDLPAADTVVHLAGRTNVTESWKIPGAFHRTNFLMTLEALEFARKHQARFIYVSSYMYGTPRYLPIDEAHPLQFLNPYAASKHAGEVLCRSYAQGFNMPLVIVRPFNIYGPGAGQNSLISLVVGQALHDAAIDVADLAPRRDYLYVDDFADALCRIIDTPRKGMLIYNAGSGKSHSVGQAIDILFRITGDKLPVNCREERRAKEIDDCYADYGSLATDLGWRPQIGLRQGLEKMVIALQKNSAP